MTPVGDDQPVTLRDIYQVGVDTREKVINVQAEVGELRRLRDEDRKDLDEAVTRIGVVERGHSKIIGAATAAATVAASAITIIGWVVTKGA